ncbi:SdrD B-like domain-containing protein [Lentzea sp. NPDC059081]|uniref:SdrD B-like domain-containing protein n=1 Tax=Lentzea sp. NPDC059081 TaxID=3346719 RepID=UPI0036CEE5EF
MSERSVSRALLRIGALTTAVVLSFGAATAGAFAQDEPETPSSTSVEQAPTSVEQTPTSVPSTPPSTSESTPPSSTESAPPSTSEQSTPPSTPENAPEPPKGDEPDKAAAVGSFKVRTFQDKNGNGYFDPGEQLVGVKVAFRDKRTGAVAERSSGADGWSEFTGLPVGGYWLTIDPAWKFTNGSAGLDVQVTESGGETTLALAPGAAPPSPRGTLWFEKSSYQSHETVRFWLNVTNVGGQNAEHVKLDFPIFDVTTPEEQWGDFGYRGAGILLAPGESRTFEATGTIREFRDGKLVLWGSIAYDGRPNPHQSGYHGEVAVVQSKGSITGVVYNDKNRNGQQDAGEAAADAVVEANGGAPYGYFKTTTDANGRYSFNDIPSGDYYVGYTIAGGWVVHSDGTESKARVQPGAPLELVARAERPYSESLSATLTLDKEVYQADEDARITITLTNSGDRAMTAIQAWCNRIGDENQFGGRISEPNPPGWGDLRGAGVTVEAGETRTIVVVEKVPPAGITFGKVIASCGFAPHAGWNTDAAEAFDSARVPGGFGSVAGELYYDRNGNWTVDAGEAIGNTRIVLRDRELGVDVAETFSDDKGHVRFDRVPAGTYFAWVDGPWQFEGEWGGHVAVYAGSEWKYGFPVVPGPAPDHGGVTGPAAPAGGAGAGGGSVDALAKTGASVLGLGVLGALLVAFGVGASVIGRRRIA